MTSLYPCDTTEIILAEDMEAAGGTPTEENSLLIAAAPEMLEALEMVEMEMTRFGRVQPRTWHASTRRHF